MAPCFLVNFRTPGTPAGVPGQGNNYRWLRLLCSLNHRLVFLNPIGVAGG